MSRILLVEDEVLVRSMMSEFLRFVGYEVVEAENADIAFNLLQSGSPIDLVFSDINMPGSMDGCGLAQRVRALWPSIKVLLATGYRSAGHRAAASRERILEKPYRPRDVLIAIVTAMEVIPHAASASGLT